LSARPAASAGAPGGDAATAEDVVEGATTAEGSEAVPVSVSYRSDADDDGTNAYLLAGVAVLAVVLAGGMFWRRRRLL
jgi:LPXTG-motif cell wall-anchored protein